MAFWLPFKFLFTLRLIGFFFTYSPSWFFFCAVYSPRTLPLSMNLWLREKALKEGLARVNGGQLCQLLHPNEAALSFTKPQLITLQAISEQDCLSAPPRPHPPPPPFLLPLFPTINNIMTRHMDERHSDSELTTALKGKKEDVCCLHASISRTRLRVPGFFQVWAGLPFYFMDCRRVDVQTLLLNMVPDQQSTVKAWGAIE